MSNTSLAQRRRPENMARLYESGETVAELARMTSRSVYHTRRTLICAGVTLRRRQVKRGEIIKLIEQGVTTTAITEKVGTSRSYVCRLRKEIG